MQTMERLVKLKDWTIRLQKEVYAISLAQKDPRTPWFVKVLAACVAGYAFSPIDLIPDFIPVLGLLDDIVLIPLGVTLVVKLIPDEVFKDCRKKAAERSRGTGRKNWIIGGIIIFVWIALGMMSTMLVKRAITQ